AAVGAAGRRRDALDPARLLVADDRPAEAEPGPRRARAVGAAVDEADLHPGAVEGREVVLEGEGPRLAGVGAGVEAVVDALAGRQLGVADRDRVGPHEIGRAHV